LKDIQNLGKNSTPDIGLSIPILIALPAEELSPWKRPLAI